MASAGRREFWDYNLESFTLMAGLAAMTTRIQLFATCAVLTMPPPIAARMAVTIDSISHGRFGVNIISGWQRARIHPDGHLAGHRALRRRYDYCAEYVTIMHELWDTGRSDFKGDFFQMDDCRCLPTPTAKIPIICAAQSDAGTRSPRNTPTTISAPASAQPRPRWRRASRGWSRRRRRPAGLWRADPDMIIADETDEAAMAKWEHYKAGTDLEALAYRDEQAQDDPSTDIYAQPNRRRRWEPTSFLPSGRVRRLLCLRRAHAR